MDRYSKSLPWHTEDDHRHHVRVALGVALVLHGALALVHIADEKVVLPPVDVVIRPTLASLVPERRQPPPTPEPQPETAAAERRVPVPPALAPPEPLPARELTIAPVALSAPVSTAPLALPAPPPMPERAVRFTGAMERPVRIAGLDPVYTEPARRVRKEGVVILDAVIDKAGRVSGIEVVKGLGFGLTEAAVAAVESWRFEPARLDGRPITVRYNLTVRFSLR